MDVVIQLPVASPHAYLAWVAWWKDVEELLGSNLAVEASRVGWESSYSAEGRLKGIIPGHIAAIEEEARRALEEERAEIAPKLGAPAELWQEWLQYGRQRRDWLETLALKGLPVPVFPEDLVVLWKETLRTIEALVSGYLSLHNLKIVPEGGPGRFRLIGELEIDNVETAAHRLEGELRAGRRLWLDLSEVTFMDSKGLGLLLRLRSMAEESGLAPVVLVAPSPVVRSVLTMALPDPIAGLEVRA